MADEDPIIDGRLLSSLKVAELREELEKHGLPSKGVKKDLQIRLKEHLASAEKLQSPKESPMVTAYRERQRIALAEQRAADPRNKQKSVSEDQVSSTKPVDQSPQKQDGSDEKSNAVEAEPEKQEEEEEDDTKKEAEQVEQNEVATEKSPSESSDSTTTSSSTSSSEQSREASPEKTTVPEPVESPKDDEEILPDSTPSDPLPEEPVVTQEELKTDIPTKDEEETVPVKEEVNQETIVAEEKNETETNTTLDEQIADETEKEVVASAVVSNDEEKEEVKREDEDHDELDYGDEDEKDAKDEAMDATVDGDEEEEKDEKKKSETENEKKVPEEKEEKRRGAVSHRRTSSPSARHPISDIIHIRGLVRPFTERMLREVVSTHGGEILDFWIDKVKSHCFIKMSSDESAATVLKVMNATHWPESNPKLLSIVHDSDENMTRYKEGRGEVKLPEVVSIGTITGASRAERISSTSSATAPARTNLRITVENAVRDNSKRDVELKEKRGSLASRLTRVDDKDKEKKGQETERKRQRSETPPFSRGAGFLDEKRGRLDGDRLKMRDDRRISERVEPTLKTPDELFKKTKTLPALYYLPLTDKQIAEKEKRKATTSKSSTERPRRDN